MHVDLTAGESRSILTLLFHSRYHRGQANHFVRYAPEDIPYGKQRYVNETIRLYSVLESRLQGRDWLVGSGKGQYSMADVNAYPWVQLHKWAGVRDSDVGPNVKAWLQRNLDRPAVKRGMAAPGGTEISGLLAKVLDPDFETKYAEEATKHAKDASKWILKGMQDDAAKNSSGPEKSRV